MLKLNIAIIFACFVVFSQSWWDLGHMLTSRIAWNYLTDLNQTQARNKFNQLVEAFNPFTDGKSQTFTEAAVWPDDIKSYGASFFDNYHFTNM